jgi:hypothetical protein
MGMLSAEPHRSQPGRWTPAARDRLASAVTAGLMAVLSCPAVAGAASSPAGCAPVASGRYVVLGQGVRGDQPVVRLLQETWDRDGSIQGQRINRDGERLLEASYRGRWHQRGGCQVGVDRDNAGRQSHTVDLLDRAGRPRLSISTSPGIVLWKQLWHQPSASCRSTRLQGLFQGQMSGRLHNDNAWKPATALLQLQIRGHRVTGSVISSAAGEVVESAVEGVLDLQDDCRGRLRWSDAQRSESTFRVIVDGMGQRLLAVSEEPELVMVGALERQ